MLIAVSTSGAYAILPASRWMPARSKDLADVGREACEDDLDLRTMQAIEHRLERDEPGRIHRRHVLHVEDVRVVLIAGDVQRFHRALRRAEE